MKVVHLSAYDLFGGAAKAAFRLHETLCESGVDSTMLVRRRDSDRLDVIRPSGAIMKLWSRIQRRCDRLPLLFQGTRAEGFSPGWAPDGLVAQVNSLRADVVHLHWVAHGFLRSDSIAKIKAPVIWTMHDMWTFTGGCHYAGDCRRFVDDCGCCPLLGGGSENDLSRSGWKRRNAAYPQKKMLLVSPSRWLAEVARTSALLRRAEVRVIPNGIDANRFSPRDRKQVRTQLNLPTDKILLLAGSAQLHDNPRKGFPDLLKSLARLRETISPDSVEVVLFGSAASPSSELMGFKAHHLGVLRGDDAMAAAYASADIFVAPSLEDNLPNTVIEAMSTGTPVVAYDAGGIPEIVDDQANGLLAPVGQPARLAEALSKMCTDQAFRIACGPRAREKILGVFTREISAQAYRSLYEEIVTRA